MFLPERGPKKKSGIKLSQIPIVIICLLVVAYAVISIAFKPLHNYLLGLFFEKISKTELAIKHYQKVTATYRTSSWAEPSSKAMSRIGRRLFGDHLDLQYYKSWTATSKILLTPSGRSGAPSGQPIELASTIAFKPGFYIEEITRDNRRAGMRLLNSTGFAQYLGSSRQGVRAGAYAQQMEQLIGFGPDKLFDESAKEDALDAFFDKLEMRFMGTEDHDDTGEVYVFSVSFSGNGDRKRMLGMLSGPFFDWCSAVRTQEISEVKYAIRVEDGFLARADFMDPSGATVVLQIFSSFESGTDIPDSRFAR